MLATSTRVGSAVKDIHGPVATGFYCQRYFNQTQKNPPLASSYSLHNSSYNQNTPKQSNQCSAQNTLLFNVQKTLYWKPYMVEWRCTRVTMFKIICPSSRSRTERKQKWIEYKGSANLQSLGDLKQNKINNNELI